VLSEAASGQSTPTRLLSIRRLGPMRRPATQSPRQRLFEWTEAMRWEDLPIDVHHQLVVELRALLERLVEHHAAAHGARSDRSE
jgi:hypothetical protein